jgi:hypothetical protein
MTRTTAVLTTLISSLALASSAQAATTFNVDKTADDAGGGACAGGGAPDCSLRSAIEQSNLVAGRDTIALPSGTYMLAASLPTMTEQAIVSGAGARSTIIDGAGVAATMLRGNDSASGALFSVSDLAVQHAFVAGSGAALSFSNGDAEVRRVAVLENQASGIGATDNLTLDDSVVARNTGSGFGGVVGQQLLAIRNSTISANTATAVGPAYAYGGGVVGLCISSIQSSTIASNRIADGVTSLAGTNISSVALGSPGCPLTMRIANSVVADGGANGNCGGVISSLGHNVDSDGTCGLDLHSDASEVDAKLGPLANNGGPTDTRALLEGSPAIDAGADCPAADQRGIARNLGAACDAGAFESAFTKPAPVATTPPAAVAATTSTPAPPVAADKIPAKLTLSGLGASVKRAALNKGLKLKLTSNEPVSVDATLFVAPRKVTIARSYDLSVATTSLARAGGTRTLTLKPTKKISTKRKVYAQLRIVAIDAGGNRTTLNKLLTVK